MAAQRTRLAREQQHLTPRLRPANLRAAWWAWRASRIAARLATIRVPDPGGIPAPPRLPDSARRGVVGALARSRATCLSRSLVLQAWDAAHGRPRELVIGVTAPGDFHAHAWLEGDPPHASAGFTELLRVPAP